MVVFDYSQVVLNKIAASYINYVRGIQSKVSQNKSSILFEKNIVFLEYFDDELKYKEQLSYSDFHSKDKKMALPDRYIKNVTVGDSLLIIDFVMNVQSTVNHSTYFTELLSIKNNRVSAVDRHFFSN